MLQRSAWGIHLILPRWKSNYRNPSPKMQAVYQKKHLAILDLRKIK
jgi:hypothetical protein